MQEADMLDSLYLNLCLKRLFLSNIFKRKETHEHLLYYNDKADLNALMTEHVGEHRGKMLIIDKSICSEISVNH
jgi:hypothetical protein